MPVCQLCLYVDARDGAAMPNHVRSCTQVSVYLASVSRAVMTACWCVWFVCCACSCSLNTLKYAARARSIRNRPVLNRQCLVDGSKGALVEVQVRSGSAEHILCCAELSLKIKTWDDRLCRRQACPVCNDDVLRSPVGSRHAGHTQNGHKAALCQTCLRPHLVRRRSHSSQQKHTMHLMSGLGACTTQWVSGGEAGVH